MDSTTQEIKPIAIPGIHERLWGHFQRITQGFDQPKVLEIGAGHGAFTKKLYDAGYDISACDLFPEIFYFDKIECKKADITQALPYEDNSFDIVMAIEVLEHVHDHEVLFREVNRILKKGGLFLASTPNILSLKSRVRFLFSGFYYSFKPLEHERNDGLQHLASLTIDQYRNLGIRYQFPRMDVSFDKRQSTSRYLGFLVPFIWLYCKIKKIDRTVHNRWDYLTGRVLFLSFWKG